MQTVAAPNNYHYGVLNLTYSGSTGAGITSGAGWNGISQNGRHTWMCSTNTCGWYSNHLNRWALLCNTENTGYTRIYRAGDGSQALEVQSNGNVYASYNLTINNNLYVAEGNGSDDQGFSVLDDNLNGGNGCSVYLHGCINIDGEGSTSQQRKYLFPYTSGGLVADHGGDKIYAYVYSSYSSSAWNGALGIVCLGHIWCNGYTGSVSDRRIKKNIVEMEDDKCLKILRDISCVEYCYRDIIKRGTESTPGFIAQQVKQHFPTAVKISAGFIADEMLEIENPIWSEVTDISGVVRYKLTIPDLKDNSGNVDYKFIVGNYDTDVLTNKIDNNSDDFTEDELKGDVTKTVKSLKDDPKSFIFEKKWSNVICKGRKVEDLHNIVKDKLFTLNFSATQEIDRIQQAEKTKLAAAEARIASLETQLAAVLARLDALENN